MNVRSSSIGAITTPALFDAQEPQARHLTLDEVGRYVDLHAIAQTVMVQLSGGVFLTGFALALGASELLIGIIAALPFVMKLSQLYLSWRVEKLGRWRHTAFRGAVLGRAALLLAAFVPVGVAAVSGAPFGAIALTGIMALFALGATVFELGYLTWLAELIPEQRRGVFWGKRGRMSGFAALAMGIIAAFVVQQLQTDAGDAEPFGWMFAFGALVGLVGLLFLRRIPDSRRQQTRESEPPVAETLLRPTKDANYRRLLIFAAWWGFAGGLIAPFFTVYMLQDLRLSILEVTILTTLTGATMSLVQLYWGRLGDRFGAKTVLRVGTYLVTVVPFLWLFTGSGSLWLIVVIQLLSGLGWGAHHLSLNNLILNISPPKARPSYLATYGAVNGVSETVAPILGGAIIVAIQGFGFDSARAFHIMVAVSLVLFAVGTHLLTYVHEEGASTVGRMIRVMGRYRGFRGGDNAFPQMPLFDHVYTHLARMADLVARERPHVHR